MAPTQSQWPPVLVVIPVHNGAEHAVACLESLAAAGVSRSDVVIIDNGSTAQTVQAIRVAAPEVEMISQANLGFAAAANRGIRRSIERGCSYSWLLNSDTRVPHGTLETLIQYMDRDENYRVGACSPVIYRADDPAAIDFAGGWIDRRDWTCGHYTSLDGHDNAREPFLTGCSLLVRNLAVVGAGMFDERFFLYWEDGDLCLRLRAAGYGLTMVPEASILHCVGGSSPPDDMRPVYYVARNRFLICAKHSPPTRRLLNLARLACAELGTVLHYAATEQWNVAKARGVGLLDGLCRRWGPKREGRWPIAEPAVSCALGAMAVCLPFWKALKAAARRLGRWRLGGERA